jgi:small subunit ribosomal protein S20
MPHIPVHPSAQKRHRQNLKRAERNRAIKSKARGAAKEALTAIEATDQAQAGAQLKTATKVLSKAASAGTMHRNTARRKIARLAAAMHRKFGKTA